MTDQNIGLTGNMINWDLSSIFSALDGDDFRQFCSGLDARIERLEEIAEQLAFTTVDRLQPWVDALALLEAVQLDGDHYQSYIYCLYCDGSEDQDVQHEYSKAAALAVKIEYLADRIFKSLARMSAEEFEALMSRTEIRGVAAHVRQMVQERSTSAEVTIAHELAVLREPALGAWENLYKNLASQMTIELAGTDGDTRKYPISARRQFYADSRQDVRDAAFSAVRESWQTQRAAFASCLISVAQSRNVYCRSQGYDNVLGKAFRQNRITRQTIDVMMKRIGETTPVLAKYMALKAKLLGKEKLGFQDLMVDFNTGPQQACDPAEAINKVISALDQSAPTMAASARKALENNWVKMSSEGYSAFGDFCAPFPKIQESRLVVGFGGTLLGQNTMAHELGHAYHANLIRAEPFWRQQLPVTLAETASTVSEITFRRGRLARSQSNVERKALIGLELNKAVTYLALTPSYYLFESNLYSAAESGELTPDWLDNTLMAAQVEYFSDAMQPGYYEPHGWAANHLLYDSRFVFSNFPYIFAYMLSLLIADHLENGKLTTEFEAFLMESGSDSVENLCLKHFGLDMSAPEVWDPALNIITDLVNELEASTAS